MAEPITIGIRDGAGYGDGYGDGYGYGAGDGYGSGDGDGEFILHGECPLQIAGHMAVNPLQFYETETLGAAFTATG